MMPQGEHGSAIRIRALRVTFRNAVHNARRLDPHRRKMMMAHAARRGTEILDGIRESDDGSFSAELDVLADEINAAAAPARQN